MSDKPRQASESRKNKISWHIADLLRRDIAVAYDCTEWLQPKQRDIDRKSRPKRHAARYIAACMVVESVENPAFAKEVLDRTEGKVADRLIADHTKTVHINIQLAGTPQDLVVEGQVADKQLTSSQQLLTDQSDPTD